MLRLYHEVTIIKEDLILLHYIIQDEGLEKRTPTDNEIGIAFVLKNWRVTIAPSHCGEATLKISFYTIDVFKLRTTYFTDMLVLAR
jgi:hypothetical protein